jgi:hypothetical protein
MNSATHESPLLNSFQTCLSSVTLSSSTTTIDPELTQSTDITAISTTNYPINTTFSSEIKQRKEQIAEEKRVKRLVRNREAARR